MSMAVELLGLVISNPSLSKAPTDLGLEIVSSGNVSYKISPVSSASTRTNSPGGSSSVSLEESSATAPRSRQSVFEAVLSDLRIDSPETLSQRRRVRELMLGDLGIDLPETTSTPAAIPPPSNASACPTDLPPCMEAPRTPPVPVHTPCVEKAATRMASVSLPCDIVSTSPSRQGLGLNGGDASQRSPAGLNGGDASQRSPAPRPGLDASQRSVPGRHMPSRGGVLRLPRPQPLGDVTPASTSSPPLSIASTRLVARKSSTPSHDASTRSPLALPASKLQVDVASIVSTCPAVPKSATCSHDASQRSPAACPGLRSPVGIATTPVNVVSTCPIALRSTPSHDASTRSLSTCPFLAGPPLQKSPVPERSDAVKCWLLGAGNGSDLNAEELAEALRAAAPEVYED